MYSHRTVKGLTPDAVLKFIRLGRIDVSQIYVYDSK